MYTRSVHHYRNAIHKTVAVKNHPPPFCTIELAQFLKEALDVRGSNILLLYARNLSDIAYKRYRRHCPLACKRQHSRSPLQDTSIDTILLYLRIATSEIHQEKAT